MIVRLTRLEPVPRPRLAEARVLGDLSAATATVVVGGLCVDFWKEGDAWTGGRISCAGQVGVELDEGYLTAARSAALEALRAEIARVTGEGEDPVETLRCPDCAHLLVSAELARTTEAVVGVDCGPAHVVRFSDRRVLIIRPDTSAAWGRE